MRRRLSLTMVAMVVGALVFAGLATLGLTISTASSKPRRSWCRRPSSWPRA